MRKVPYLAGFRYDCLRALLCILCISSVTANDDASTEEANHTTFGELRVVVKDDAGNPVIGAAVNPYAMRMIEQDGHGFWDEKKHGPTKQYVTDQDGVVVVRYPSKIIYEPMILTTKSVTFMVRHSDFVQKVVDSDLVLDANMPVEQANVELKKGCELQLSAVDENGAQVSEFGVIMAGRYAPAFWANDGNGGRRTGALSDGTWQTMLVKPQDDGPTLFSGVLPLRVRPAQAVKMRNVKLSPGSRIMGTLSDNVTRPVIGGYVITTSVPKPEGDSYAEESPSLSWHDTVPISADGKFELPSVPRSGVIQIIAVCDGWVSKTTPDANNHLNHFVMGQLFDVSEAQVEIALEMEQTGSLELLLLKPDGTPLDDGEVSSWPNQKYFKGGSTLLGQRHTSIEAVRNQLVPFDQKTTEYFEEASLPFVEQPVVNGVAVLRGIPLGKILQCMLQHKGFQFPNEANANENDVVGTYSFSLESEEPKKVTITVVPHEKTTGETP